MIISNTYMYSTPQIKLYVSFTGTIVLRIEINCRTIVLQAIDGTSVIRLRNDYKT